MCTSTPDTIVGCTWFLFEVAHGTREGLDVGTEEAAKTSFEINHVELRRYSLIPCSVFPIKKGPVFDIGAQGGNTHRESVARPNDTFHPDVFLHE